jgi:hypothetical protein
MNVNSQIKKNTAAMYQQAKRITTWKCDSSVMLAPYVDCLGVYVDWPLDTERREGWYG